MKTIVESGGMKALENLRRPITPGKFAKYKHLHEDYPVNPFEE